MQYQPFKINFQYILTTAFAVIFSWFIHEAAHYLAGNFLGYDMAMTMNQAFPTGGSYKYDWHNQLISAAGPFITIIEALVVFLLMRRKGSILLYPFLFTCFYMRFQAAVISFFNLNDEARISKAIGLGKFTLPVLVVFFLAYLLYKTSTNYRLTPKFNWLTLGLLVFFGSVIILSDQYLKLRIF